MNKLNFCPHCDHLLPKLVAPKNQNALRKELRFLSQRILEQDRLTNLQWDAQHLKKVKRHAAWHADDE